jgi:hypothetical protein
MVVLDLVGDRAPHPIGARPEAEASLDQAACELVEFWNAAGAPDAAVIGSSVDLDDEDDADLAADSGLAEVPRVVGREYLPADLLKLGPAPAVSPVAGAGPCAARSSTGTASDGWSCPRSAAWRRRQWVDWKNRLDRRALTRASQPGRAAQGRGSSLRSGFRRRFRFGPRDGPLDRGRRRRLRKCDLDELLRRLLHSADGHVKTGQERDTKRQLNDSRRG